MGITADFSTFFKVWIWWAPPLAPPLTWNPGYALGIGWQNLLSTDCLQVCFRILAHIRIVVLYYLFGNLIPSFVRCFMLQLGKNCFPSIREYAHIPRPFLLWVAWRPLQFYVITCNFIWSITVGLVSLLSVYSRFVLCVRFPGCLGLYI